MKRSELKRKTPMKRSTKPMKKRNPERQARERAETDGPCAAMARSMPCLMTDPRPGTKDLHDVGYCTWWARPDAYVFCTCSRWLAWFSKNTDCIGDTDPDHVRTRGARGKDWANVVPLCRGHHTEKHTIGIRTFEKRYGVNLEREAQKIADRVEEAKTRRALDSF